MMVLPVVCMPVWGGKEFFKSFGALVDSGGFWGYYTCFSIDPCILKQNSRGGGGDIGDGGIPHRYGIARSCKLHLFNWDTRYNNLLLSSRTTWLNCSGT